jgi:hypothetical protein
MHDETTGKTGGSADLWTLIAVAILAYVLQNVLHEGVGHGGACLLVGAKLVSLSTAYLDWDSEGVTDAGRRIIASAGTLVNLAAGLLFWFWLRSTATKSSAFRLFLWLSMSVNLLTATGYLLFSGALNVGDWMEVVRGWQPAWAWRLGLVFSGSALYFLTILAALRELNVMIGDDTRTRVRLAFRLSIVSYLAGCVGSTIGSFLNPISMLLVATSAAASFGGTSALAWMTQLLSTSLFPPRAGVPISIRRSWTWIAVAGVVLSLHILVLGSGLGL